MRIWKSSKWFENLSSKYAVMLLLSIWFSLGPYLGGSCTHPTCVGVFFCLINFNPKVAGKLVEVGFLSPAEHPMGFEALIFWFYCDFLNCWATCPNPRNISNQNWILFSPSYTFCLPGRNLDRSLLLVRALRFP